ncbi:thymidylate kinase [Acidimicrobiaceae bacterium]|nr:thymidylate kinase [Acidimicrobiaceae bacterium]
MSLGKYIAFEGLEGCGKSTHVKRLATRLNAVMTREPGGTAIGSMLRDILIDPANTNLSPRAEALMMAADRAQHIAELISPALASGQHVVTDRSVYSSLAYQGYGRQQDLTELKRLNNWAINNLWPDLVIYIDVPIEVLLERLKKRELDRFEREDRTFFERIDAGFRSMAASDPQHWLIVDGTPPKDELEEELSLRGFSQDSAFNEFIMDQDHRSRSCR